MGSSCTPKEAHKEVALGCGEKWERQPGDENHYGNEDCLWCTKDGKCPLCDFANAKGETAYEVISTSEKWLEQEDPEIWGERDWKRRQYVRVGLLENAWDLDYWSGSNVDWQPVPQKTRKEGENDYEVEERLEQGEMPATGTSSEG